MGLFCACPLQPSPSYPVSLADPILSLFRYVVGLFYAGDRCENTLATTKRSEVQPFTAVKSARENTHLCTWAWISRSIGRSVGWSSATLLLVSFIRYRMAAARVNVPRYDNNARSSRARSFQSWPSASSFKRYSIRMRAQIPTTKISTCVTARKLMTKDNTSTEIDILLSF